MSVRFLLPLIALGCLAACGAAEPATSDVGATDAATASAAPTSTADAAASASAAPATASAAATAARPTAEPFAVPPEIQSVLSASDRSADDRALDEGRHPGEMLAFFGVGKGMKVAELGAGGGYTAELLARTVGPTGKVYGHNSKFLLERFAEKPWSERLKKPVMKNVVRLDRPFDDPFPKEVKDLDGVLMVLFYHDMVWQKVDRDKANKAIFAALKPGGFYGIVDHSGRAGTGSTETETL
ncbi:MAG: class I SAM-dependent methyltransferase, partial [Polyangiaceae bacterium]|nr:class I SAM-dependent methyltransferase [Polyangiaceae bacterium]